MGKRRKISDVVSRPITHVSCGIPFTERPTLLKYPFFQYVHDETSSPGRGRGGKILIIPSSPERFLEFTPSSNIVVAACDERSLVVDDNDDENKEERLFISDRDFNWIIDRALKLNYLITGSSFWYLDATPDPRSTQPDVSLGNRKQQVTSNPPGKC